MNYDKILRRQWYENHIDKRREWQKQYARTEEQNKTGRKYAMIDGEWMHEKHCKTCSVPFWTNTPAKHCERHRRKK